MGQGKPSIWATIRGNALFAVVVVILLVAVEGCVEGTALGRLLLSTSYEICQMSLAASTPRSDALPVTVLDISDVGRNASRRGATDRRTLWEIVEAVAAMRPRAIGADIDFSPIPPSANEPGGFVDPVEDPRFLMRAVELSDRVPIFVGVGESRVGPPEAWLGNRAFAQLAGAIVSPETDELLFTHYLQYGDRARLYGLPSRLVLDEASIEYPTAVPPWLGWAARDFLPIAAPAGVDRRGSAFYVDYGHLDNLVSGTRSVSAATHVDPLRDSIEDRVVVLGRVRGDEDFGRDEFSAPGHWGPGRRQFAGVYMVASAALTLQKGGNRLFVPTNAGRLVVDLLFALATLVAVGAGRGIASRLGVRIREDRVNVAMALLAVAVTYAVGIGFVIKTRVLWDDFLITAPIIVLAPWLERRFGQLLRAVFVKSNGGKS